MRVDSWDLIVSEGVEGEKVEEKAARESWRVR